MIGRSDHQGDRDGLARSLRPESRNAETIQYAMQRSPRSCGVAELVGPGRRSVIRMEYEQLQLRALGGKSSAHSCASFPIVTPLPSPWQAIADAEAILDQSQYPYLRRRCLVPEKQAGDRPIATRARMVASSDGRMPPPGNILDTFSGAVEAYDLNPGVNYYRIVGCGSVPSGAFWTDVLVKDPDEVRTIYAIKNAWSGDHGLVVFTPNCYIRTCWAGSAAPQPETGGGPRWLPGGGRQIWVPPRMLMNSHGVWQIRQLGG